MRANLESSDNCGRRAKLSFEEDVSSDLPDELKKQLEIDMETLLRTFFLLLMTVLVDSREKYQSHGTSRLAEEVIELIEEFGKRKVQSFEYLGKL